MIKEVWKYIKLMKKNIMYFENIYPTNTVKITGIKKDRSKVITFTDVTEFNKQQIKSDIALIKSLKDTSIILGDDVPSLLIPFEEEGLACSKMKVDIKKH